jgi:hypothetical protein
MLLGEAKREAPAQAELRPTAPGELIQAKMLRFRAFIALRAKASSLYFSRTKRGL